MTTTVDSLQTQLHSFFVSRRNFYQLLHLLFFDPNETFFLEIKNNANLNELAEIHKGGKILHNYFAHLEPGQVKKDKEEYQRLFIGPGPLAAPPWESCYRSKEHLLFEEWTYQIREQYHKFGLQYIKENNEPDDHLLLELEFMNNLADFSLKETDSGRIVDLLSSQIHFLEKHLTVWIPYFCRRVIESTNNQLYLGAAMLLEDFLSFDLTSLIEVREALSDV